MSSFFFDCLDIMIHVSALMCAIKCRNKVLRFIFECIYCIVIFVLPVTFLSFLLTACCFNENVNAVRVFLCIGGLCCGSCIYFIIANWKSEKTIEGCLLSGALYLKQYFTHKKRIDRQKIDFLIDIFHVTLLFAFFSWVIVSLMVELFMESNAVIVIGFGIALFFTYLFFVYGKREEATIKKRKALLGALISLTWILLVCIRIYQYWKNITLVGVEDMFILLFSALFTIPTIYEWFKNIPARLIEPYTEIVYRQKIELTDKYMFITEEGKKEGIIFIHEIKEFGKIISMAWKATEKKKIVKFVLCLLCMVLLMGVAIWGINILAVFLEGVIDKTKTWYENLNGGIQEVVSKVLVTIFVGGLMSCGIVKAFKDLKSISGMIKKMKYIVELLVFEVLFGIVVLLIWGFWG